MSVFLRGFSKQLAPDIHAALVVDGAGWHIAAALQVPDNITLVKLPPYAPELNPIERVWLYLRKRFLSHRLNTDQEAVMDAACKAWNRLTPKRLRSLCNCPWIREVSYKLGTTIHAPGDAVATAQLGDAGVAAKAIQHDADLVLGRVVLPVARRMSLPSRSDGDGEVDDFWFICMSSLNVISQKPSFPQLLRSVS